MRFLENLVSDMVRESTGINPRRVVRMVGGRRLLKLGAGAAALGGLAHLLEKHGDVGRAGDTVRSSAGPPPPPLPSSTSGGPPPLPPIPGSGAGPPPIPGTDAATAEPPAEPELPTPVLFASVRAMAAAAAADGHLADRERTVFERRLEESEGELDAAARQQLRRELEDPPSPAEIAAGLEEDADRETVYRLAALVLLADGAVSEIERGWLGRLAEALGVDGERRRRLEEEVLADSAAAPERPGHSPAAPGGAEV